MERERERERERMEGDIPISMSPMNGGPCNVSITIILGFLQYVSSLQCVYLFLSLHWPASKFPSGKRVLGLEWDWYLCEIFECITSWLFITKLSWLFGIVCYACVWLLVFIRCLYSSQHVNKRGKEETITTARIVVAVGKASLNVCVCSATCLSDGVVFTWLSTRITCNNIPVTCRAWFGASLSSRMCAYDLDTRWVLDIMIHCNEKKTMQVQPICLCSSVSVASTLHY